MTSPNQPSSSPVESATPAETSTATTDNASPDVNIGMPDIHAPGQAPGGAYPTGPNIVSVRPRRGDGPPPGQAPTAIAEPPAAVDGEEQPDDAPNIVFVGADPEPSAGDGAAAEVSDEQGDDEVGGEDAPNIVTVTTPDEGPADDEDPETVEPDEATTEAGDGPPPRSANKPEWVDYAVARGASKADAEAMTKDQLIDTYGSKES